ncbi:hypothetical protein [Kitasatospora sp. NPDC001132]
MANANKRQGTSWESAVRDFLNRVLGLVDEKGRLRNPFDAMNVRRVAQEGSRDVGDVHAVPFVLEAKDVAKATVPTWIRQAETEAGHAGFPFGIVVHKLRRANVRAGKVHFGIRTWTRVRLVLGLSTREFYDRYRFTFSVRGLDSGKWYATTDLERLAVLLADVRNEMGGSRAAE